MAENWLSLERTVDFVQTVTGSSLGPACQTLISICESGEVRARWTDYYEKTLPPIHKRDWIGADIDWDKFQVVKADGRRMAGVDFSVDDLNTWASKRSATQSANAAASADVKEAAATSSSNGKHPGGSPSTYDLVEIKLFFQQQLKARGDPTNEKDQGPGWKSIEDAMKVIRDHMEERGGVPQKTRFREVLNGVLSDYRRAPAPLSGN